MMTSATLAPARPATEKQLGYLDKLLKKLGTYAFAYRGGKLVDPANNEEKKAFAEAYDAWRAYVVGEARGLTTRQVSRLISTCAEGADMSFGHGHYSAEDFASAEREEAAIFAELGIMRYGQYCEANCKF